MRRRHRRSHVVVHHVERRRPGSPTLGRSRSLRSATRPMPLLGMHEIRLSASDRTINRPAEQDQPRRRRPLPGAVAKAELRQDARHVALDGRLAEVELLRDLCVRDNLRAGAEHIELALGSGSATTSGCSAPGSGRLQKSSIRRRVTEGARSASPPAMVRTPEASCSRVASLRRKPLAPAFIAR